MQPEVAGLRQRKKDRTRRALVDAAARLFSERGYEETTIGDIAAAVEVATRTFFSYFPAKEDVLFADVDDRIAALSELEFRLPGERLLDALRRVGGQVAKRLNGDIGEEGGESRRRAEVIGTIVASRPSLQAAALRRQRAVDRVMSARLHAAYPDELDEVLAAVVVASLTAALRAAGELPPGSRPSARDPHRVIDRVLHLLEHGLGGATGMAVNPDEPARRRRPRVT
jgi:AcrR family transcriptional regulator